MDSFLYGVEYETNLLIHDPSTTDRVVIWASDKTQITTEFWDVVLGHKPYVRDERYWINGVPQSVEEIEESKNTHVYNLEAQSGVYKGINSIKEFDKNIDILDHQLKGILSKRRVKTDAGKKIPIFGYTEYQEEEENVPELYLDRFAKKRGVYPANREGVYAGYRTDMFDYDITGKPQLTCTIRLDYIVRLFELIYNHSENYYEQIATSIELAEEYMLLLPLDALKTHERNEMHGFVLYLLHYFEQYKRYQIYLEEQGDSKSATYFKSFFFIKPRTNPASLYTKLSSHQKSFLTRFQHALRLIPETDYTAYMLRVLSKLDNTDCVYVKNLYSVPNGLYRYDVEDLDTYLGFQNHKKQIEVGVPCVEEFHEIPSLSYYGENDFVVQGTHSIWEWKSQTRAVAYEFRDMMEMVAISMSILREEENEYYYQFFKADMITPFQLKEMIHLLMRGFFKELFSKKRVSRSKCPQGQVWDKDEKRCRASKRRVSTKKCPQGQVWDKDEKRCRASKRRVARDKCKEGQVWDKDEKQCRESKRCKKGEKKDKSTKRCIKK